MSEGKVKLFNPRSGYGFIEASDGQELFVHFAGISGGVYKTLKDDDIVTFDITRYENGFRAENVVLK